MALPYLHRTSEGGSLWRRRFQFLVEDKEEIFDDFGIRRESIDDRVVYLEPSDSPLMSPLKHEVSPFSPNARTLSPLNRNHLKLSGGNRFSGPANPHGDLSLDSDMSQQHLTEIVDWSPRAEIRPYDDFNPVSGTFVTSEQGRQTRTWLAGCMRVPKSARPMNILIASQGFNSEFTSKRTNDIMEAALLDCRVEKIYNQPISDGGACWLEAMQSGFYEGSVREVIEVQGLYANSIARVNVMIHHGLRIAAISTFDLWSEDEMSDPGSGTSYGLGIAIIKLHNLGCDTIYLGVAGKCLCIDGGAGLAQALGVNVRDADNQVIEFNGTNQTSLISYCDVSGVSPDFKKLKIVIGTDELVGFDRIDNRFENAADLNESAKKFAVILSQTIEQPGLPTIPGAGVGGGIAFVLKAFCDTEIMNGFDVISNICNLRKRFAEADLVISACDTLDLTNTSSLILRVSLTAKQYNTQSIIYTLTDSQGEVTEVPEFGVGCIVPLKQSTNDFVSDLRTEVFRSIQMLRAGRRLNV